MRKGSSGYLKGIRRGLAFVLSAALLLTQAPVGVRAQEIKDMDTYETFDTFMEEEVSKEDLSKEDLSKEDLSKEDLSKEALSGEELSHESGRDESAVISSENEAVIASSGEMYASDTEHLIPDDADMLFAGYVEKQFLGEAFHGEYETDGILARDRLNTATKAVYDKFKPRLVEIAANGGSSNITLQLTSTEAGDTFEKGHFENKFSLKALLGALLADMPYELYWFNKSVSGAISSSWTGNSTEIEMSLKFKVADAYKGNDEYTVKSGVSRVSKAVSNARSVVTSNASKDDYSKLAAYSKYICDAVAYNNAAAENPSTPYGDPWQLIYVFDGDSSTNVVCEGYAKAFKYLCDMTSFTSSGISCIIMTGQMGGGTGAGPHMWNIVKMDDGNNYITDITNVDSGTIGYPDKLFLAGTSRQSKATVTFEGGGTAQVNRYEFPIGDTIYYINDYNDEQLFAEADIAINTQNYKKSDGPSPLPDQNPVVKADGTVVSTGTPLTKTIGDTPINISITGLPASATVTYSSDNSQVASVSGSGNNATVTLGVSGTAKVTINSTSSNYNPWSFVLNITVKAAAPKAASFSVMPVNSTQKTFEMKALSGGQGSSEILFRPAIYDQYGTEMSLDISTITWKIQKSGSDYTGASLAQKSGLFALSLRSSAAAGDIFTLTFESGLAKKDSAGYSYQIKVIQGETPDENGYTVTFYANTARSPMQILNKYTGVRPGSTIARPEKPVHPEGTHDFDDWYRDSSCSVKWDFSADTVDGDISIYAGWKNKNAYSAMSVASIPDIEYTGKAVKPAVKVYDGDTLLVSGRDYTAKYYGNNKDASADIEIPGRGWDTKKTTGANFTDKLPYVEIKGKGIYEGTIYVNYRIIPKSLGTTGEPAPGTVLQLNRQLIVSPRPQAVFKSLKSGASLKMDVDFTIEMQQMKLNDAGDIIGTNGALIRSDGSNIYIPQNTYGTFLVTVRGEGNYTGSIEELVYCGSKEKLIKNAKIVFGSKELTYDRVIIENYGGMTFQALPDSDTPGPGQMAVISGGETLLPTKDYVVSYSANDKVGKAKITIQGRGAYLGEQSAEFTIKGNTFTKNTLQVSFTETPEPYTGSAIVKNASVSFNGTALTQNSDYRVSYKSNIKAGKATVTFTGIPESGYTGSISRTFTIAPAELKESMLTLSLSELKNVAVEYNKAGAKIDDKISLVLTSGGRSYTLRPGVDYTLAYANNKTVTDSASVTVKGKGNFKGEIKAAFKVVPKDISGTARISIKPIAYKSTNKPETVYKLSAKIWDGSNSLSARDFELSSSTIKHSELSSNPTVLIKYTGAYSGSTTVVLPIQRDPTEKLTASNTMVVVKDQVYTGSQLTPSFVVYRGDPARIKEAKQKGITEDAILIGTYNLERIDDLPSIFCTASYGANIAPGKNKGSVTVSIIAPGYAADLKGTFNILPKEIK